MASQLSLTELEHLKGRGLITYYRDGSGRVSAQLTPHGQVTVERLQGDPEVARAERLSRAERLLTQSREALSATKGDGTVAVPRLVGEAIHAIDEFFA